MIYWKRKNHYKNWSNHTHQEKRGSRGIRTTPRWHSYNSEPITRTTKHRKSLWTHKGRTNKNPDTTRTHNQKVTKKPRVKKSTWAPKITMPRQHLAPAINKKANEKIITNNQQTEQAQEDQLETRMETRTMLMRSKDKQQEWTGMCFKHTPKEKTNHSSKTRWKH